VVAAHNEIAANRLRRICDAECKTESIMKMQIIFQIFIIAIVVLLLLLRIDIAKIRRLNKRSQQNFKEFGKLLDALFVRCGETIIRFGHQNISLMDTARDPAERIAAIHIALGAARVAMNSNVSTKSEFEGKINSSARSAIAAIHTEQETKRRLSRKWANILGIARDLSPETISNAKRMLIIKAFSDGI